MDIAELIAWRKDAVEVEADHAKLQVSIMAAGVAKGVASLFRK